MKGIPNGTLPSSREIRSARAVDAEPPMTCTTSSSDPRDVGAAKKVVARDPPHAVRGARSPSVPVGPLAWAGGAKCLLHFGQAGDPLPGPC